MTFHCRVAAAIFVFMFSAPTVSFAADDAFADRWEKIKSLTGDWRGALVYLDYTNGKRQSIGQAARLMLSPDGAFLISDARFTDPGFDVYINTIATIDPKTGDLLESFHRDRSIDMMRFRVVSDQSMENGWELVLVGQGEDDERPATIRRTMILDGDMLTRRKEVDFLDDEESEFIFRNETILTRSAEPVGFGGFRQP